MDKLPTELLFIIMMYLPPMDRLSCSLTCRRLAEVMTSAQLLDDVWLDIAGREMKKARSVLLQTQRQYTKLLLYGADMPKFDSQFWERIGANLRVLELNDCSWSNQVFYAILRQCTMLESLKIVNVEDISIDNFILPEGTCHENLRDSLSHLRHLNLNIDATAEILDLLLGLMPNVTSIYLAPWLDEESDFLERLPSILKKNGVICTGAKFGDLFLESEELIKFVEITSGSLEEILIDADELTESACDAIVKCTRLRRLTLYERSTSFHANHLEKLVSNSPDLEILELNDIKILEDEGIMHLLGLKKLRSLGLRAFTATNESLFSLKEISTLVELDFKYIQVDSRLMRNLGSLRNLRTLVVGKCLDSECFEALCENLGRLTELDLGSVKNLKDADGLKLCRLNELQSLKFYDAHGFSDVTFERGVGSRTMKSLRIEDCSITDAGLVSLASHHDRLERMDFRCCENITAAGVLALLRHEPRLKELAVIDCAKVRYELRAMRRVCPRLRHVYVNPSNPCSRN